jgi:hypothetical protein
LAGILCAGAAELDIGDTRTVDWRQTVAHAATPWEWKQRGRVVVLVAVAAVLCIWSTVAGLIAGDSPASSALIAASNACVTILLFVRPSLRSLRRWDE